MDFHGDLGRHLIRNNLYELIGNIWIYGYGVDIQWDGYSILLNFVQFSLNCPNTGPIFVDFSLKFHRNCQKIAKYQ